MINRLLFSATLLWCVFAPALLPAQDATDIIRQAEQKLRGATSHAEITMNIIRPDWSREMSIKSWSKGDDLALILITAPARDKGTTFLKRDKEIWNWVLSIERTVKLPPSMMMQSWMGSDFTNDDLVRESSIVDDYTHELVGDSVVNGYACYQLELTPKPEAPVVWGKLLTWITKESYLTLMTKFYDEDGYLINVMQASDIQQMDDREIPTYMEMIPVDDPGHKTTLKYHSVEFNEPIDDSFFSVQNMKRVR